MNFDANFIFLEGPTSYSNIDLNIDINLNLILI